MVSPLTSFPVEISEKKGSFFDGDESNAQFGAPQCKSPTFKRQGDANRSATRTELKSFFTEGAFLAQSLGGYNDAFAYISTQQYTCMYVCRYSSLPSPPTATTTNDVDVEEGLKKACREWNKVRSFVNDEEEVDRVCDARSGVE